MTAITDSTLPALRARFGEALAARLPEHIARLGWDALRLAGHQRERLQALLACASRPCTYTRSPVSPVIPRPARPAASSPMTVATSGHKARALAF